MAAVLHPASWQPASATFVPDWRKGKSRLTFNHIMTPSKLQGNTYFDKCQRMAPTRNTV